MSPPSASGRPSGLGFTVYLECIVREGEFLQIVERLRRLRELRDFIAR